MVQSFTLLKHKVIATRLYTTEQQDDIKAPPPSSKPYNDKVANIPTKEIESWDW